jgi:hypothetical protein
MKHRRVKVSLKAIRDSFHSQLLKHRNFETFLQTEDFEIAYRESTVDEKKNIGEVVKEVDLNRLKEIVRDKLKSLTPFHEMTIRDLRKIGSNLAVKSYAKLLKKDLIKEIEDVVHRIKANSNGSRIQSKKTKQVSKDSVGCR